MCANLGVKFWILYSCLYFETLYNFQTLPDEIMWICKRVNMRLIIILNWWQHCAGGKLSDIGSISKALSLYNSFCIFPTHFNKKKDIVIMFTIMTFYIIIMILNCHPLGDMRTILNKSQDFATVKYVSYFNAAPHNNKLCTYSTISGISNAQHLWLWKALSH